MDGHARLFTQGVSFVSVRRGAFFIFLTDGVFLGNYSKQVGTTMWASSFLFLSMNTPGLSRRKLNLVYRVERHLRVMFSHTPWFLRVSSRVYQSCCLNSFTAL